MWPPSSAPWGQAAGKARRAGAPGSEAAHQLRERDSGQERLKPGGPDPGVVPCTGKRYLVDASVSQTGRDPEPLLSVTARLLEPVTS